MADPFSTAAGVVGVVSLSVQLLGGCIKGFILLSTAHNLGNDVSTIVCLLELQEIQLTEWARRAGLLTGDGVLDRRLNAHAVEQTLLQLQNLLLDTDQLKKRYGLKLVQQAPTDLQTTSQHQLTLSESQKVFTGISDDTRRQIMTRAKVAQGQNIFKRLWWAAVDKEKIEKLVGDVQYLVRELWHLLDPWRHDDLANSTMAIASNMVRLNNRFDQLTSLIEALNALQGTAPPLPHASLKSVAVSAEVKALRVGLGDDDDQEPSLEPKFEAPKRQDLLRRLERLSRFKLTNFKPMKKHETMGLADYDGQRVFVEWKPINPLLRSKILPRAETLAALLSVPKDETFRSLTCKGIVEQDDTVSFVFDHPIPSRPEEPRSLLDLFSAKDGIDPPSLSDRIRLALQIARTVQNFHRSGWLHKSLRSENILFFSARHVSTVTSISDPVLAGFNFARFSSPTEISEQPSGNPKHDIYRHPSAMGEPSLSFSTLMDVYSLGTVMLEIAEWRALRYLVDSVVDVGAENVPLSKLAEVRPFLLSGRGKGGTSKLRTKMGDIYTSVCLMCLGGKVEGSLDYNDRLEPQESLLDVAVQLLESCNI